MRFETIVLLTGIILGGFQMSAASAPRVLVFGSLHMETMRGEQCDVSVRGTRDIGEHRELLVTCGGKTLFLKRTPDFLLDIQTDSSNHQRLFIRWEGGQTRLQVLELTVNSGNQDIVAEKFNESSEFMPDVLASPDVLLVQREKRIDLEGKIIPSRTDVFAWKDDKYELRASWRWEEGMQYDDRFCVLLPKVTSCHVVQLPHP